MSSSGSLAPGQTLSHFRLLEKIGEGGMGVVWRAVDESLGREVAIKLLPDSVAQDPARLARLESEAKTIAALNHPHIVTLYSLEQADARRFLTMELVSGRTRTRGSRCRSCCGSRCRSPTR